MLRQYGAAMDILYELAKTWLTLDMVCVCVCVSVASCAHYHAAHVCQHVSGCLLVPA